MHQPTGEAAGLVAGRMAASIQIAAYEVELAEARATIAVLKGALGAANPAFELSDGRPWMKGLTRQECALVGALFGVSPRVMSPWQLLELMPGHDHVEDRRLNLVAVTVLNVRRKLGRRSAIENVRGRGYFMPIAERDRLLAAG